MLILYLSKKFIHTIINQPQIEPIELNKSNHHKNNN